MRGRREEVVTNPPACLGFLAVALGGDAPPLFQWCKRPSLQFLEFLGFIL